MSLDGSITNLLIIFDTVNSDFWGLIAAGFRFSKACWRLILPHADSYTTFQVCYLELLIWGRQGKESLNT